MHAIIPDCLQMCVRVYKEVPHVQSQARLPANFPPNVFDVIGLSESIMREVSDPSPFATIPTAAYQSTQMPEQIHSY